MMIVILNHVHSGGEDCVMMKVSLNTLIPIHPPLGQTRPDLREPQPDEGNYAAQISRRLPTSSP